MRPSWPQVSACTGEGDCKSHAGIDWCCATPATDEALYQALQQVASLDAENARLREVAAEASLRAVRAADDCSDLAGQLLDAEIERDMLRCVCCVTSM